METPKPASAPKKRGRIENLKPWQPGQSGNPNGRPKKLPITDALREQLGNLVEGDKKGRTFERLLADVLISMAVGGGAKKLDAIREILDRVEGKAVQRTEVSGPGGGAVVFETPASRAETERRIQEILGGTAKAKKASAAK